MYSFMEDIFTQRTHPEPNQVYVGPEIIVKHFFDWPQEITHAWGYRSLIVPERAGYNVCFRPAIARKKLVIDHVLIGKFTKIESGELAFEKLRVLKPTSDNRELYEFHRFIGP